MSDTTDRPEDAIAAHLRSVVTTPVGGGWGLGSSGAPWSRRRPHRCLRGTVQARCDHSDAKGATLLRQPPQHVRRKRFGCGGLLNAIVFGLHRRAQPTADRRRSRTHDGFDRIARRERYFTTRVHFHNTVHDLTPVRVLAPEPRSQSEREIGKLQLYDGIYSNITDRIFGSHTARRSRVSVDGGGGSV